MTSNMIRAVATPAPVRERTTNEMARKAINNSSKMAAAYGIKMDTKMMGVTGRVLDGPKLDYRKQVKFAIITLCVTILCLRAK